MYVIVLAATFRSALSFTTQSCLHESRATLTSKKSLSHPTASELADDERSLEHDDTVKDCNGRLVPRMIIKLRPQNEVSCSHACHQSHNLICDLGFLGVKRRMELMGLQLTNRDFSEHSPTRFTVSRRRRAQREVTGLCAQHASSGGIRLVKESSECFVRAHHSSYGRYSPIPDCNSLCS